MRSEQEILDLVIKTAQDDERIRAVIMNGSRANPNAPRDPFQDFDIVYIVTDVEPFKYNFEWIKRFGELMIMQMPEDMQNPPPINNGTFNYLMQFTDGNRIDLGFFSTTQLDILGRDSLSVLLLDKDGLIEPFPPSNESDYLPKPPTAKAFADCCNEFWWLCGNISKGLWREEILYARYMFDHLMREQFMFMMLWYIGLKTNFSCNPGKMGKYYQRYLEPELWDMLLKTYADASYEHTWDALFTMCDLFRRLALTVAGPFGFEYSHSDDQNMMAHLSYVRGLPRDAKEIYQDG